MVRRSDVWVFNIRQHHISHNFSGPDDASVHGESNVGQPWFGKSGESRPEMDGGDIVLVRRTSRGGDLPSGVVGLWKYSSTRPLDSLDHIPWEDKAYRWVIYCRPIQRRIEPAYTEEWNELPFSYRQFQSEVISLSPYDAFVYLRELLHHGHLFNEARRAIEQRYQIESGIGTNLGEAATSNATEPQLKTTEIDRRLRNERLARELKGVYDDKCQVCGDRRSQGNDKAYSEVHHIKPLGRPHTGPDDKSNMLVLCPNHHADFDNGVIIVHPDSKELVHPFEDIWDRLWLKDGHRISSHYCQYHLEELVIEEAKPLL